MKHKWKMIAAISIFFKLLNLTPVEGKIECHYCGIKDTCTLPYVISQESKIECDDSCMKFDGKEPGGKRVVVRSCGSQNSSKCFYGENWNKAIGEICYCKTMNCNFATTTNSIDLLFILMVVFIVVSIN